MKKMLLLTVLGFVTLLSLSAQSSNPPGIGIGGTADSSVAVLLIGQPYSSPHSFNGFCNTIDNSEDSLLCYAIGDIPNMSINPQIKTRFRIQWKNHPDAVYFWDGRDQINENLNITLTNDGLGAMVEYIPDENSYEALDIEFSASDEALDTSQVVRFIPSPILPDEFKILSYEFEPDISFDTVVVHQTKIMDTVLNFLPDTLVKYRYDVMGKTIVFKDGTIPFTYSGRQDILELNIYAINLIVEDTIMLPHGALNIYAQNIIFKGEKSGFNLQPSSSNNLGRLKGLNSKGASVYGQNMIAQGEKYRFYLAGGKGADENDANNLPSTGGGNAGCFTSNLGVQKYVCLEGGQYGKQIEHENRALVPPSSGKGHYGLYKHDPSTYKWLHPNAIRMVLQEVREQYIYGHNNIAYKTADAYIKLLNGYFQSQERDTSNDLGHRLELDQMYKAFNTIHSGIANNLDYFGNPQNWAPLLSFESNYEIYNSEIDYTINVLFLNSWIKQKADNIEKVREGAEKIKKKYAVEIMELNEQYNEALDIYPSQKNNFIDFSNKLYALHEKLQFKIDSLMKIAKNEVKAKNKWKGVLYDAGTVCSFIPAYQQFAPVLQGAAKIDYNDPWTMDNWEVVHNTLCEELDIMEENAKLASAVVGKDQGAIIEDSANKLRRSLDSASPENLRNMEKERTEITMPMGEVMEKFNKLKANCPAIENLTDSVEIYAIKKGQAWEELSTSIDRFNKTSSEINRLLVSIDAMNKIIIENENVVNPRAIAILHEGKKAAWARLLKYQYYLAKAYQYRFLEPYEHSINLQPLFEKIDTIARKNDQPVLSDYESLKTIFESSLREISEKIYDGFNNGTFNGTNTEENYRLSPEELEELNATGEITINLWESGQLPESFTDARINDCYVKAKDIEVWSNKVVGGADLKLIFANSGKSNIISPENGLHYSFNQYNSKSKINADNDALNPLGWGLKYLLEDGTITKLGRSAASEHLIMDLLDEENSTMLYSRPSAWSDIRVITKLNTKGQVNIKHRIDKLILTFNLDFKGFDLSKQLKNVIVRSNYGLEPLILCDDMDVNGLSNGRGCFTRTFNDKNATFEAPMKYGNYKFKQWKRTTNDSYTDSSSVNYISVSKKAHNFLTAEYELAIPEVKLPDTLFLAYNATQKSFAISNINTVAEVPMHWNCNSKSDWLWFESGNGDGLENGNAMLSSDLNNGVERTGLIEVISPNTINPIQKIVVVQKSSSMSNLSNVLLIKQGIQLYPVPAKEFITLHFTDKIPSGTANIRITNSQGKTFMQDHLNIIDHEVCIDIQSLPKGIYLIYIKTKQNEWVNKLIKL